MAVSSGAGCSFANAATSHAVRSLRAIHGGYMKVLGQPVPAVPAEESR